MPEAAAGTPPVQLLVEDGAAPVAFADDDAAAPPDDDAAAEPMSEAAPVGPHTPDEPGSDSEADDSQTSSDSPEGSDSDKPLLLFIFVLTVFFTRDHTTVHLNGHQAVDMYVSILKRLANRSRIGMTTSHSLLLD